ncbi:hypothetical protein NP568_23445, partial [Vibrio parahaemolyticus]|nr:hypothetical protein [Vibrio parahaemolyticus]
WHACGSFCYIFFGSLCFYESFCAFLLGFWFYSQKDSHNVGLSKSFFYKLTIKNLGPLPNLRWFVSGGPQSFIFPFVFFFCGGNYSLV